jgi:hypothetical protein
MRLVRQGLLVAVESCGSEVVGGEVVLRKMSDAYDHDFIVGDVNNARCVFLRPLP